MADVDINKFRASVVREGSKPASPGFIVSEGQSPTDPAGSGQNHLPVTIATAATGLSITESQVLGGAGTVGQYIRGDGSLADFPESSGGGSSVSYYLNGSVAQGTIGGVAYKELNKVPILGAGTDFTINADGYIASFITDAGDPNLLEIPGGNWNFETYFSSSSSGGTPSFYVELYKYDGSTFTLLASNSSFPEFIAFGTIITPYFSTLAVPTTTLALTDRLAIRYYVTHSGRTITLHTEDNHLCQIVTTFTTGITALNGLTAQVQNFAVGTSGTDFAIASATATHTFNLPTASATNRGALSSADWTTFNNKTSNLGTVTSVGLSSATSGVTIGSTPVTTSGTITLAIATASGSQNGLLSSTDWTTFNSKQNALTNPVTGTGTSGQVAYFTGTTAISSESNLFWDATNDRLGIGTAIPSSKLEIVGDAEMLNLRNSTTSTITGRIGVRTDGAIQIYSFQSGVSYKPVIFGVDGSFTSAGNLLVGTTTDNGARLQVSGTARVDSEYAYYWQRTSGGSNLWSWSANSSSSYLYNHTTATPVLTFLNNGNVGIGTTTPDVTGFGWRTLTIRGGTTSGEAGVLELQSPTTTGAANLGIIAFMDGSNRNAQIGVQRDSSTTTANMFFYTNGGSGIVERLKIASNGASTFNLGSGEMRLNRTGTSEFLKLNTYYLLSDGNDQLLGSVTGATSIYAGNGVSPRVTITSGGNVLIGTTTDSGGKLRVDGDVFINNSSNAQIGLNTTGALNSVGAYLYFNRSGSNKWTAGMGPYTGGNNYEIATGSVVALSLAVTTGTATFGSLGTGTVSATSGTLSTTSDLNYKIEDGYIDSAIEKVLSLKPRYFYWNEKSGLPTNIRQLGFYAQEVNQALGEEAANTPKNENTPWGISDRSIIAMLTKAIQELKQEIDTLKN